MVYNEKPQHIFPAVRSIFDTKQTMREERHNSIKEYKFILKYTMVKFYTAYAITHYIPGSTIPFFCAHVIVDPVLLTLIMSVKCLHTLSKSIFLGEIIAKTEQKDKKRPQL